MPGDIINANQTNSVLTWQYNWAPLPPVYLATSNVKYIPMQWGSVGIDTFADDVKAQGADTILVCLRLRTFAFTGVSLILYSSLGL